MRKCRLLYRIVNDVDEKQLLYTGRIKGYKKLSLELSGKVIDVIHLGVTKKVLKTL